MTTATIETYRIEDITLGERFRKDLGDVTELQDSIEELGLLHPIVVTTEGKLIAGARRLEAAKNLGWEEVPVTIAQNVNEAAKELLAERDENTCRMDMKPSEAARLGMAIEEIDAEQRRKNRLHNLSLSRKRNGSDKSTDPSEYVKLGAALDVVGPAVGMSPAIYNRAKVVVRTAEDENAEPEVRKVAQKAVQEMDRTGKVTPNWRAVKDAEGMKPPREPGDFATWDKTSERYKSVANKIIKRVWDSLNRFEVAAPDLAKVDMEVLVENLSSAELKDMHEMAGNTIKGLKAFQRHLKDHIQTEETD